MALINPGVGLIHSVGRDGIGIEVLPLPSGVASSHPFLVKLVKVSDQWHFKVVPGTVNSKVPTLSGTLLDAAVAPTKSIGSNSGYVYLDMEYTEGTGFPDTFTVEYDTTVPADTDTKAYVALAYIDFSGATPKKTAKYVLTSLWGERLKCGSSTAEYYFSRA